jgi:hypothetical protein
VLCLWQIRKYRCAMGWSDAPPVIAAALLLWSAPVVFAMERGNCDVLVLLGVMAAASALGKSAARARWQSVAAVFLVLASAIKVYPLAAVVALLAMRQYLAAAVMAACCVLLVIVLAEPFAQWLAVLGTLPGAGPRVNPLFEAWSWLRGETGTMTVPTGDLLYFFDNIPTWASLHSPADIWPVLWFRLGHDAVATWPVMGINVMMLAPVTLWGLWKIVRSSGTTNTSLPVLLWIMAVATFWMPFSYDYNLIFLPLLIVATWDKREPPWMQALLILSLPWWLPFGPAGPADFDVVLGRVLLKVIGLYVATCLLVRSFTRAPLSVSG